MNTKENEAFIDGLQGKLYVCAMMDGKNTSNPKISERMTLEEVMKKYNQMRYMYSDNKPMLGHFMYVARYSNIQNRLEGTEIIII